MAARRSCRLAFTLLELVLVIAIIATLLGLLLPQIQGVRERANLAGCRDNLRRLGLAAHNYDSTHNKLPPGNVNHFPLDMAWSLGAVPPNTNPPGQYITTGGNIERWQNIGCIPFLLPFLELDNIHRNLRAPQDINRGAIPPPAPSDTRPWWRFGLPPPIPPPPGLDYQMANRKIKGLWCPADNVNEPIGSGGVFIVVTHSRQYAGAYIFTDDPKTPVDERQLPQGRSNYAGCAGGNGNDASNADPTLAGAPNLRVYEGVMTNRRENRLSAIPDGTSNTLMFGEGIGRSGGGGRRDFAWSWMGVGSISTKFGLLQGGLKPSQNGPGANWGSFSSRHTNGVNFCFADGTVRMLKFGTTHLRRPGPPLKLTTPSNDWWLLQQLGGIRDGGP